MAEKTLSYLFEEQRKLDAEIERKHPAQLGEDRTAKKLLALSVELGECANEWRGFKFWSENQTPKTFASDSDPTAGIYREWNPLLEEYIDCLHFALSIGNEYTKRHSSGESAMKFLGVVDYEYIDIEHSTPQDITVQFLGIQNSIGLLADKTIEPYNPDYAIDSCKNLINHTLGLGEMLGFSWEQIIKAYEQKNAVNYQRQAEGY